MAALPDDMARIASYDLLTGPKFRAIQSGHLTGHTPVAMLDKKLADELGSKSRVVLFSNATAAKQLSHHSDLKPNSYLILQEMLDKGDVIQDRKKNIGLQLKSGGRWWRTVVKATKDGSELYLTTFHKITTKQRDRALRSGTVLRGG